MNSETIFGEAEILEINEAGSLTTFLKSAPRYHFGAYPALDMHAIPYAKQRPVEWCNSGGAAPV